MRPIPTRVGLTEAYDSLQWKKSALSEHHLAIWISWIRFDSRLFEILIKYISEHYQEINPFALKKELQAIGAEAVACVLCDITEIAMPKYFFKNSDWVLWKQVIQNRVAKVPFQAFYIGLTRLQPLKMHVRIQKNLKPYEKWGFYGNELPISDKNIHKKIKTLLSPELRTELLKNLLDENKEITVTDYIEALNGQIHRRQAERDLENYKGLKKTGNTRRRIYRKAL